MEKLWITFLIILVVIIEVSAEYSLTKWGKDKKSIFFLILGCILYIGVALTFAFAMRNSKDHNLTILNGLWQVLNLVIVSFIGIVFLKDKTSTFQKIGIGLGILATIFLLL